MMLRRMATAGLAVLALLTIPAIAHAEDPFSGCALEEPIVCAAERKEAAEESSKKTEEQAPATLLNVTVRSHHGSFYGDPGHTDITVTTSPYARVTVTVGTGHVRWRQMPNGTIVTPDEERVATPDYEGTEPGPGFVAVSWRCRDRGQTVHFSVQAQGGSGPPLMRTGHFKIPLTARWCAAAKHKEQTEIARHHVEERKKAAEHARREREKYQHEVERYETTCRAIGGIPVEIHTSEGNRIVCHSKTGGVITVPQ